MLKVTKTNTEIEGGLVDILAEYAAMTAHMINAIREKAGTEVAEAMVLKAFIMGHQSAGEIAKATEEAPDA